MRFVDKDDLIVMLFKNYAKICKKISYVLFMNPYFDRDLNMAYFCLLYLDIKYAKCLQKIK